MPNRGVTITEPEHATDPVRAARQLSGAYANAFSVRADTLGPALRDALLALYPVKPESYAGLSALQFAHAYSRGGVVVPEPVHPDDPHDFPELTPEQHAYLAGRHNRNADRDDVDANRKDDPEDLYLRIFYAERAAFHRERAAHHRAAAAR